MKKFRFCENILFIKIASYDLMAVGGGGAKERREEGIGQNGRAIDAHRSLMRGTAGWPLGLIA